ncbi:aspartate kinase [Fictibacillus sp. KIGAM418]|uniref:Aspartokinase n=1 Tax=Fictibacillus marinisediminis TaxID=2878389 RepID=A0A9X2BB60_9BACL|nr:aspartate kinase [Fictibacillus marinisediminis]MCK6255639.1 aspartate kinase [Fictibacillus marinisediminis]
MKVVKFGGSSLSCSEQVEKVFHIVVSDPERKVVVVSAPGKRFAEDTKVTDLLIECAAAYLQGREDQNAFQGIIGRYESIAEGLQLPREPVTEIKANLLELLNRDRHNPQKYMDAVKASGEDSHARLIAAYFRHKGIDAHYVNPEEAGLLVTDEPGNAQPLPETYDFLYRLRDREGILIFPGFFGFNRDGEIVTFSRSGSDITGSILASGIKADVYENFTDVDAVYSVNPKIINRPKEISEITYREMRELSYAGFSVFHDEALMPAFKAGIPVNVKNTNQPKKPGTMIVKKRELVNGPVIGIASDEGFCSIYVSKYLLNREIGFGRRLLSILEDFHLSFEHMPSGIDDISIILRQDRFTKSVEEQIVKRIKEELQADDVKVERDLALIMMVGEGMRESVGTAARASTALAKAGVNIEMINQGSSEVSMMFGVRVSDERKAVQALYEEFFAGVAV